MEIENTNQNTPEKNLKSIIRNKSLDFVESHSLSQLFKMVLLHILVIVLTSILISPKFFLNSLIFVISAKAFILPKFALCSLLVWKFPVWSKYLTRLGFTPKAKETIEGVPVGELLHHLFTENSLKFEAKKKLGFTHARFCSLVSKLEKLNVLVRGENNSRVLNPDFSREQVADILRNKSRSENLSPALRIFRKGKVSIQSLVEKKQFVSKAMSPSLDPFSVRKIAVVAG
ncbi:MAG: hypothetical protein V3U02_04440 [Calditrichia bacterium]